MGVVESYTFDEEVWQAVALAGQVGLQREALSSIIQKHKHSARCMCFGMKLEALISEWEKRRWVVSDPEKIRIRAYPDYDMRLRSYRWASHSTQVVSR